MKHLLLALTLMMTSTMPARPTQLYIGTSSAAGAARRGIFTVRFDPATGALGDAVPVADVANPTFLALHPNGRMLYAIDESAGSDGRPGGAVRGFAIDATTGALTTINEQPSGGAGLTHLVVDATGAAVVGVSYGGGYVVSFPLDAAGRLGPRVSFIPHQGPLGPNRARQDKPHPHSATLAPDNRFVFVADLGLDRVFAYRLDAAGARLAPHAPPFFSVPPGAGPRHTKFSPDGKFFYVLNEVDGTISVCTYGGDGTARPIQQISTLPAGFKITDEDRAAEIRIRPDGRFVYASNRGANDTIAVFARDGGTGRLKLVELVPSGGGHPRNFALSPDGAWLVCANRDSNNLVSFRVDPATGRLTPAGRTAGIPLPTCVLFAE